MTVQVYAQLPSPQALPCVYIILINPLIWQCLGLEVQELANGDL